MKRIINFIFTFICFILAIVTSANALDSNGNVVVVSMGDSYSSGEGIEPFYGQNKKYESVFDNDFLDWVAHRSEKSWPGLIEVQNIENTMSAYKNDKADKKEGAVWYFVAASGATTENINDYQVKEVTGIEDPILLPAQIEVFKKIEKNSVDFVTITMGGNDVNFSEIIELAALTPGFLFCNALQSKLNDEWDDFYKNDREKIKNTYLDIYKAAGSQADILVAGYPELICESSSIIGSEIELLGAVNHSILSGIGFSFFEAKKINEAVDLFNDKLKAIVDECNEENNNNKIHFVSVKKEFDGRGAYAIGGYINGIKLYKKQDIKIGLTSAYSIHPNEDGAKAYAACVNREIKKIEKGNPKKPSPTPTLTPTPTSTPTPTPTFTPTPSPTSTPTPVPEPEIVTEIVEDKYYSPYKESGMYAEYSFERVFIQGGDYSAANDKLDMHYQDFLGNLDYYKSCLDNFPYDDGGNFYDNVLIHSIYMKNGILSVCWNTDWMAGGVYNSPYETENLDINDGEKVDISWALGMSEEEAMEIVADAIYDEMSLYAFKSGNELYSEIIEMFDEFNWFFDDEHVYVIVNEYELAPGAAGSHIIVVQ